MNTLISAGVFLLGLAVGSFLNVLVLRFKTSSIAGRSFCFSCGRGLRWYELVPVLSFAMQGGRCRTCRAKISWQYPLVELLTGAIFVFVFYAAASLTEFLFAAVFFSILIFAAVYDALHKIIPEEAVYSAAVLSALFLLYKYYAVGGISWIDASAGVILGLPLAALTYFSGGRLMGLGDAKLMFPIGTFLGISAGASALILSFWLGAFVSLILIGVRQIRPLNSGKKPLTMKSEVPFAPFLVAGGFIAFIFDLDIAHLASFL